MVKDARPAGRSRHNSLVVARVLERALSLPACLRLIDPSLGEAGSLDVALGHSPLEATDKRLNDGEACSIVRTDLGSETWAIGAKALRRGYGEAQWRYPTSGTGG